MSQFVLCKTANGSTIIDTIDLRSVAEEGPFLQEAAHSLFGASSTQVCVPYHQGRSMPEVFDDAHNELATGGDFEQSSVATMLRDLMKTCDAIVLWWSSDWSELPCTNSQEQFMHNVCTQLTSDPGEVYARWYRD